MKLKEIAKAYANSEITADEARDLIHGLELPVYDGDWDGVWLLEGDDANSKVGLRALKLLGELTENQYRELVSFFPEGYKDRVSPSALDIQMSKGHRS